MRALAIRLHELPPVVLAGAAQLVALAVVLLTASVVVRLAGVALQGSWLIWFVGGLAMALGARWGLPGWWRWIQLLFVPALYGALQLQLPPAVYLGGLLVCLLLLGNSVADRVPLYLSSAAAWEALERLLPLEPGQRVLDLGSGFGGGLACLAGRHPQLQFIGLESSPLLWLAGWLRLQKHTNAEVRWKSLWSEPLQGYQVVYAFLSPAPMERLWRKVKNEMQPGTLFISNSFEVPGVQPDARIEVGDRRGSILFLWRL